MLAGAQIPLAVCSGALLSEIEMILQGPANLRELFRGDRPAEQVKKGKPHPEGFLLVLKLLNKKSKQQISQAAGLCCY